MPMELDLGPSARAFRDEVRGWLEANGPEELVGVDAERLALQRVPGADDWARKLHEAGLRQHLAWAWTCVQIMRYQGLRTLSEVVARKEPGPASALNKMFWSEYAQRFAELVMNIRGADSMVMPDAPSGGGHYEPDRWQRSFLGTRSVTIWGGTAQVQRNIVGERVLGLPKDPAPGGQR
jgi:alkylation response protein AidB-like acyl-CoA dehydrogenase